MSDQEQESLSEKELAEFFQEELYSDKPRSVGEAVEAAEQEPEPEPEPTPKPEPPVEVVDEPIQPEPETPEAPVEAPTEEPEPEEPEEPTDDDPNVVWAKKKYGDDPMKWAKAARDMEQHISRLAAEKKEAEELAGEWYDYAQQAEAQAKQQTQMGLPLSSSEENWIEQSVSNPLEFARNAAYQGNVNLYNGVISRVAEENPMLAAQIGTQVQMELQQLAAQQGEQAPQPTLQETLSQSISRLGIDLSTYGEAMGEKVGELGEYHPYVQTILGDDPASRDLALMAVYDLVRAGNVTVRKVQNTEREQQIQREAELRKQAAGVVTGAPTQPQPPKQSPFMDEMEKEWRARGQWGGD